MSYIGPNELVFNNDTENGIHTGGFNVKSIMMKEGLSPIMTMNNNNDDQIGGNNLVSDIFDHLVVPNWALSYYNPMFGGDNRGDNNRNKMESDSEDDDDTISDDLHDKLLDLVKHHEQQEKQKNKKKKITRKERNKKGGTKKRSIIKN
jgi:hypothetical protein